MTIEPPHGLERAVREYETNCRERRHERAEGKEHAHKGQSDGAIHKRMDYAFLSALASATNTIAPIVATIIDPSSPYAAMPTSLNR